MRADWPSKSFHIVRSASVRLINQLQANSRSTRTNLLQSLYSRERTVGETCPSDTSGRRRLKRCSNWMHQGRFVSSNKAASRLSSRDSSFTVNRYDQDFPTLLRVVESFRCSSFSSAICVERGVDSDLFRYNRRSTVGLPLFHCTWTSGGDSVSVTLSSQPIAHRSDSTQICGNVQFKFSVQRWVWNFQI